MIPVLSFSDFNDLLTLLVGLSFAYAYIERYGYRKRDAKEKAKNKNNGNGNGNYHEGEAGINGNKDNHFFLKIIDDFGENSINSIKIHAIRCLDKAAYLKTAIDVALTTPAAIVEHSSVHRTITSMIKLKESDMDELVIKYNKRVDIFTMPTHSHLGMISFFIGLYGIILLFYAGNANFSHNAVNFAGITDIYILSALVVCIVSEFNLLKTGSKHSFVDKYIAKPFNWCLASLNKVLHPTYTHVFVGVLLILLFAIFQLTNLFGINSSTPSIFERHNDLVILFTIIIFVLNFVLYFLFSLVGTFFSVCGFRSKANFQKKEIFLIVNFLFRYAETLRISDAIIATNLNSDYKDGLLLDIIDEMKQNDTKDNNYVA